MKRFTCSRKAEFGGWASERQFGHFLIFINNYSWFILGKYGTNMTLLQYNLYGDAEAGVCIAAWERRQLIIQPEVQHETDVIL